MYRHTQNCQLSSQKHRHACNFCKKPATHRALGEVCAVRTCDVQISASLALCQRATDTHSQLRDPECKKQPDVSVLKPREIFPTPPNASSSFIS